MTDLELLARALVIDEDHVVWRGRAMPMPSWRAEGDAGEPRWRALRDHLYQEWYVVGGEPRTAWGGASDDDLRPRMVRALRGFALPEPGWRVVRRLPAGRAQLSRDGFSAWFEASEWRPCAGEADGAAETLAPSHYLNMHPGFFTPRLGPPPPLPIARIYLALEERGAFELLANLRALAELPFPRVVKLAANRSGYLRSDAVVIYAEARGLIASSASLGAALAPLSRYLRPVQPTMTRALAPGIGLAEDPGDGGSFGLHRCEILAKALCEPGIDSEQRRIVAMSAALDGANIPPDRPWRFRGSDALDGVELASDRRTWPAAYSRAVASSAEAHTARRSDGLSIARVIAGAIRDEIEWIDGRPLLLTAAPKLAAGALTPARGRVIATTLDAHVYQGYAGIGAFMAELAAHDGTGPWRDLARALLLEALHPDRESSQIEGYYVGVIGAACEAIRVGARLELEDVVDVANRRLARIARRQRRKDIATAKSELLSGLAGSLAALAGIAAVADRSLLDAMIAPRVDALLARRFHFEGGVGWPGDIPSQYGWLSGCSHGQSGIALGLARVMDWHGGLSCREAIVEALALEDTSFREGEANWLDLRATSEAAPSGRCALAWCHGSPGILAARRIVSEAVGVPWGECDARALARLGGATRDAVAARIGDRSLCHGAAGLAECWRLATGERAPLDALVRELSGQPEVRRWELGASPGFSPSLMLGAAGIGIVALSESARSPLAP